MVFYVSDFQLNLPQIPNFCKLIQINLMPKQTLRVFVQGAERMVASEALLKYAALLLVGPPS